VTGPNLVVLAAGRGTRFGGVKQLVAVRDDGATVTDVLLGRAATAGIERAVIVVSAEIEDQFRAHLDAVGPTAISVALAVQRMPCGTADAVLAARDSVDGAVVVVNADDLYPAAALSLVVRHLQEAPAHEHATVAFPLDRTLVGTRPESRALLTIDHAGILAGVREGRVEKHDGLRFVTATSVEALRGDEQVSMNMWAFQPSAFDALAAVVADLAARDGDGEIFLPAAVEVLIENGATVRALRSTEPCLGITYADDVAAVRAALS
jgi:molybdopterin-guanine dinucleotide biosynthesis protein A